MLITGCDFHTRYQQIAMLNEAGELIERRLEHENGEANTFYRSLQGPVRVGQVAQRLDSAERPTRGAQNYGGVPHPSGLRVRGLTLVLP